MHIANVDIHVKIRVELCIELMFKYLWQICHIFFLLTNINVELYTLVNVQNAAKCPKNYFLCASCWLMFTLNSYPDLMFKMLWQIYRLFFRHTRVSSTYPCLSVRWLVTLLDFQSASVSGRPMWKVEERGPQLFLCIFQKCIFRKCIFWKCILQKCILRKCILLKCILRKCTRVAKSKRYSARDITLESSTPIHPLKPDLDQYPNC